ncbi:phage tail protein [Vibrio sp. 378]|uniref:phage tail-collar fiber domain-containing protein n=1 Tax=Vibrio sp. 378 TaxID=3074603 RepID=UPI00296544DF|nr:phage tail protein [Vibrio sp. 378]MDW2146512.1 phage tail protein [Vibrio sp. 378]
MANTTDKSILTAAGKALLAQLNAEEKPLIIDKMIFANVPNRPEFPQPDDVVPTDDIVHQEQVEQRGRLSADSVIYSTTLTSDVGPFEFNWTGAYCSEYGVLVTIDHHALTPKTADEPGVAGNTLVRSVVLEYKDIAEITNITVDASSWQYNATDRMKKMDSDVAQSIIDQNGKDWFIEDGFLVTPSGSAYNIKAGAGYVSGNRVSMEFDRSVQVPNKPSFIYIDAHREGTPTGEQVTLFDFVITAEEKDDYIDSSTSKDIPHFVCKIAEVLADGSVSDLRPENKNIEWSKKEFIRAKGGDVGDILAKKTIADNDVKWIKLSDYVMINHPSVTLGEQSKKILLHQGDGSYQVITKKARNVSGYVMMTYQKTSAAPDASNEFGNSHHRPTFVYEISHAIVGRLKTDAAVAELIDLTTQFNSDVLGLPNLGTVDYSKYQDDEATRFNGLKPWNIFRDGDYVQYLLSGEYSLLFARSPGSSGQVVIEEELPDGSFNKVDELSLKYNHNNSGKDAAFVYKGQTSKNKLSKIRVRNLEPTTHCYLYGANIMHLNEMGKVLPTHDTAAYIRNTGFTYIEAAGANDFAFKRKDAKWFGSYHGGHHNETVKRHLSNGVFEQHTGGYFEITERLMFSSVSELHSKDVKQYDVSAETQFFDGGYINLVSINLAEGKVGVLCTDVYTSMTCTDTVFTHLEFPRYLDVSLSPSSKVLLGNNNMVTQLNPDNNTKVTSQMTLFTTTHNQYGGLRIDKAGAYNKVYYGPILSDQSENFPPVVLSDLSFVATKEFY